MILSNLKLPEHLYLHWSISLLLLLASVFAFSQDLPKEYKIEIFPLSDEITDNQYATCMGQDSTGFLWFGSVEGVKKYDGNGIKTYSFDPKDSTSISHNVITNICVSSDNQVWIGTEEGLNLYDPIKNHFKRFYYDSTNIQTLSHNRIRNIIEDKEGFIWVGTPFGINRYNPSTGDFQRFTDIFKEDKKDLWNDVYQTMLDKDGTLWTTFRIGVKVDVNAGANYANYLKNRVNSLQFDERHFNKSVLSRFDKTSQSFVHYFPKEGAPFNHSGDFISSIMEDSKGNFWVGGANYELYQFDRKSGNFIPNTILPPFSMKQKNANVRKQAKVFQFIFEDHSGKLWLEDEYMGIRLYDPKKQASYHFDFAVTGSEIAPNTDNMFQTTDGTIWALSDMVYKISIPKGFFTNYPIGISEANESLPFTRIYAGTFFENESGELWASSNYGLGLENGLMWVSSDRKTTKHYPPSPNGLQRGGINKVYEDSQGNVWIANNGLAGGKERNLLYRFDPKTENFQAYPDGPMALIIDIFEDKEENIWLITRGEGLFKLNTQTSSFQNFKPSVSDTKSYTYDHMLTSFLDSTGYIWFGGETFKDLHRNPEELASGDFPAFIGRFDLGSKKFTIYEVPFKLPMVHSLGITKEGELLGGGSNGLVKFDTKKNEFISFTSKEELSVHDIIKFQVDKDGDVWILDPRAPHLFGSNLEKRLTFDSSFGFFAPSHFYFLFPGQSKRDNYFMGAYMSYVQFSPYKLKHKLEINPPEININSFRINNEEVEAGEDRPLSVPMWLTKEIELTYDQNVFDIRFSNIDYESPDQNVYLYKLENYDKTWRDAGKEPQASYVSVPPGNYTFRVKSKNSYGKWSEEKQVDITISPPWWETTWAYIFYVFTGLGILILVFYLQRRNHERKLGYERKVNDELKRVDQLKDQFLANTSHELRTPLHGMVGLAESLYEQAKSQEDQQNLGMIIASGKRLSSLVNDLLDFSKVKNHDLKLSPKTLSLRSSAELVLQACYPLLGNKTLTLYNENPQDLVPVLADENRLQQILFNLLGNAIKFTEKGRIVVYAKEKTLNDQKMVMVAVEDTGIGIPTEKQDSIFLGIRADRFGQ